MYLITKCLQNYSIVAQVLIYMDILWWKKLNSYENNIYMLYISKSAIWFYRLYFLEII